MGFASKIYQEFNKTSPQDVEAGLRCCDFGKYLYIHVCIFMVVTLMVGDVGAAQDLLHVSPNNRYRLNDCLILSLRYLSLIVTNRKHGPMMIPSPSSIFGDVKNMISASDWSVEPHSWPLIGPAITKISWDQHLLIQGLSQLLLWR